MATITQSQAIVSSKRLPEGIVFGEPPKTALFEDGPRFQQIVEATNSSSASPQYITPLATPQTQSALIINASRQYEIISGFPAPQGIAPNEVVIRNYATGLNHIDWKSVDYNFCLPALPWITGREMAGVVEYVGCGVTSLRSGDRVWTSTYYKDRRAGCFQDLVTVPQHTVMPIPHSLDFTDAACLGVAALTAAMSMWRWLGIPMHPPTTPLTTEREAILIWGGSTVTGQYVIQLASHAGLDTIAVCSAATAPLVVSLGATHVVTYTGKTDVHVIGEILCLSKGRLTKAIDLVGASTANLVLQVIAACGTQQKIDFAPLAFMSSKAKIPSNAKVHNVEMKQFVLNSASQVYGERLNELVEQKELKLPKTRVLQGGLGAVEEGLRIVKEGSMGGQKLVVSMRN